MSLPEIARPKVRCASHLLEAHRPHFGMPSCTHPCSSRWAGFRTALKLALKRGHAARNVAELTNMPASTQRKLAPPTTDELRRLLDAMRGDRLEALVILAPATGLRRGELQGLRW
jgi:integrase